MKTPLLLVGSCCVPLLAILLPAIALAGDWPQFGGPHRNFRAAADEKVGSVLDSKGETKMRWRKDIGSGYAGPVVVDDTVFLFHRVRDEAVLDALALADGKSKWRFAYPTDYRDDFNFDDGPRAVPTVADGRILLFGAEGVLHCLDAADGKVVWKLDTREDWPTEKGFFGRACSPLVEDGIVVLQLGCTEKKAGIVGIDVSNGKVKWQATDHEAGYAAPVLAEISGKRRVLSLTREGFVCLDPATGKTILSKPFRSTMDSSVNAASPVSLGADRVFLSSCYGVGAAVWHLDPEKPGIQEIWAGEDKLDCHYNTPVFHGGDLYGFHGRQEQGQELRRIAADDGTVVWKSLRVPAGSVTLVGDRLLVLTEMGELLVQPAGTREFAPTERAQILGGGIRAYPAVSGGLFLARDKKQVVCVDISE